ncbi:hypothetical protein MHYP_G00297370 [Metynnis hypsauchen]
MDSIANEKYATPANCGLGVLNQQGKFWQLLKADLRLFLFIKANFLQSGTVLLPELFSHYEELCDEAKTCYRLGTSCLPLTRIAKELPCLCAHLDKQDRIYLAIKETLREFLHRMEDMEGPGVEPHPPLCPSPLTMRITLYTPVSTVSWNADRINSRWIYTFKLCCGLAHCSNTLQEFNLKLWLNCQPPLYQEVVGCFS